MAGITQRGIATTLALFAFFGFLALHMSHRSSSNVEQQLGDVLKLTDWPVVYLSRDGLNAQQALEKLGKASAMLIITNGPTQPKRRGPEQPFLSAVGLASALPVAGINLAANQLEQTLGRRLFATEVHAVPFGDHVQPGVLRPWAVWEVGTGTLLLDEALVARTWGQQPQVANMTDALFARLVQHALPALAQTANAVLQTPAPQAVLHVLGPALSAAIAASFAAAPPLWFCIACPAVLGLLAPLLINIALNQLAGALCVQLKLTDDECFDMLLGALGLGFVLAIASAIPIFYGCRLYECEHHDTPPGAQAVQKGRRTWPGFTQLMSGWMSVTGGRTQ